MGGTFACRSSLAAAAFASLPPGQSVAPPCVAALRAAERLRSAAYPCSRWLLRPLAFEVATGLAPTRVQPVHVTLAGLAMAVVSIVLLLVLPGAPVWAALGVIGWWFCDRVDGQLARLQGRATAWGAWLDANVDELADLALHGALALHCYQLSGGLWPAVLCAAFFSGKYLTMYGLQTEEHPPADIAPRYRLIGSPASELPIWVHREPVRPGPLTAATTGGLWRTLYHGAGNADVRVHVLALAIGFNCGLAELALYAAYYHLRWTARYGLVWSRLRGLTP